MEWALSPPLIALNWLFLHDKGEEREGEGGSFRDLRRDDRIIGLYLGPSII